MALYDKQQREVTSSVTPAPNANPRSRAAEAAPRQQPPSPAPPEVDPSPLGRSIQAFRKRFQVPAEAASIADRICQRRHHDWIEVFLVSHDEVR